jgi:FAD-linked oxidoreductase
MPRWRNWARTVECAPRQIRTPATEEELAALIAGAAGDALPLRAVGSGHSYTPLVESTGTILSLDALQGLLDVDSASAQATIRAGSKLKTLGGPLRDRGLALQNQGDVDYQSLGGALGTGTHGTGISLQCLSAHATGFRLILADGSTLDCSPTQSPEVFRAAQVSLGALGIITRIRMQLRPAYRLRDETRVVKLEEALAALPDLLPRCRHVELWWFPYADQVGLRTIYDTQEPPNDSPFKRFLTEVVLDNWLLYLVAQLTRWIPSASRRVSPLVAKASGAKPYIDHSYRVLATGRFVRAKEMEYAVPAADGPACLLAIRDYVRTRQPPAFFPIEYRYVAADEIPLSPFYRRDSAVLSVHQFAPVDHNPYFAEAEKILLEFGGRPHWGKMHTLTAERLRPMYPEWEAFHAQRRRLDPGGKFLSPYLRRLFGETPA